MSNHNKYTTFKSNKKINHHFFGNKNKFNDFFIFKFILFFIQNILFSYSLYINIKVNDIGNQQIFSDIFDIEAYKPNKILVNSEGQILREKKVYVYSTNDIIKIEWYNLNLNLNLMYMFANVKSITSIEIDSQSTLSFNISHMFYNCINLQKFSAINNNLNVSDMSYAFYNCHSMSSFSFQRIKFSFYIDMSYIFYNCSKLNIINYYENIRVSDMKYSFYNCTSLSSIILSNFKTENCVDLSYAFYNCHTLSSINNIADNKINSFMIRDMRYLFFNNTALKKIQITFHSVNTDIYFNMSYSFNNCINLESLSFDNIKPNDMRNMFHNCTKLTSLELKLNISDSKVNMTKMFFNCSKLSSVTFSLSTGDKSYLPSDLHAMFYNCINLASIDLKTFNTYGVEDMSYMFYNCNKFNSFSIGSNFNNNSTKSLRSMFENCIKLTSFYLSKFSTSNVEIMWAMFKGCKILSSINLDNFDTSKVTDMESMFEGCSNLVSLNLSLDTNKVQYMNKMFKDCTQLQYLYFPKINTSSIGTMHQMFYNCGNLKYLNLYYITDRGQSIIEMFTGVNKRFTFCIKEHENIPELFKLLLSINAKRDCSANCYGEDRVAIPQKKYCCPYFRYGYECVDKCPSKTNTNPENIIYDINNITNISNISSTNNININIHNETSILNEININDTAFASNTNMLRNLNTENETHCINDINITYLTYITYPTSPTYESYSTYITYTTNAINDDYDIDNDNDNDFDYSNRTCRKFYCLGDKYYNYEQDDCIVWPIEGYFINDSESRTLDKCHYNCSTCKGKEIEGNTKCKTCKENLTIYLGNCYDFCLRGKYKDESNDKEICKCFNEKCLNCTEDSLDYDLCISCNTLEGYYPKSDENLNISNFINCYKNPDKYYLNNVTEEYMPCFETCLSCKGKGSYQLQNCTKCDSNFSSAFPISDNLFNCYPKCKYYYYFDDEKIHHCTDIKECPFNFSYLISNETECVKNCSLLTQQNKTKVYRKTCYTECPVESYLLMDKESNICRARCPNFEEPFEMVEKQICVSNCTIMERYEGKCITNYYGNRTNAEVQDKVFFNIMDDIIDSFDYTFINDSTSIVLREPDHIYEIITTKSTVNNYNTSKLYLKNCEDILKNYYGIPEEKSLYLLKLDAFRPGQTGPTVNYQIYYPLNDQKLEQLDLTICEGQGVSLLINANITGGEDMYNKNSGYYNDICYTFTSGSGTDLTLTDRQDEFANNNQSLCEEGCEFVRYHYDTKQAECSCDVKTNVPLVSEIEVDKDKLYNFIDIKKLINFDVMKCYKLLLSIDGIKGNIGFFVFFPSFLMYFIAIIVFYVKDFKKLKLQINEIVFAKRNLQYLPLVYVPPEDVIKHRKKQNLFLGYLVSKNVDIPKNFGFIPTKESIPIETSKTDIIENKIEINININNNKSRKNKKLKERERMPEIKELVDQENRISNYKTIKLGKRHKKNKKQRNKTIHSGNIFQENNINNINNINSLKAPPKKSEKKEKNKNIKNNTIKDNNSLNDTFDSKKDDKNGPKYFTEKQKQKIRDILKHNDDELNYLSYKEALKYDKRNFIQFYFSLLKSKHLFITLLENRDYNSRIIKLFLCFFSFSFGYAVNALFFDDDTMHKIHEDGGDFNFWYQLPQIIYSTVISYILENFLNYLALSEDDILSIKREKIIERVGKKAKDTLRKLHCKFIAFFIISFIFLLIFWYYISCFCAVYRNTQYHLIKDTLISFGTSLLYPFGMYLVPPMFRIPALKGYSNHAREAMYKFSKILLFF